MVNGTSAHQSKQKQSNQQSVTKHAPSSQTNNQAKSIPEHQLLQLQRQIGNQAVAQLLRDGDASILQRDPDRPRSNSAPLPQTRPRSNAIAPQTTTRPRSNAIAPQTATRPRSNAIAPQTATRPRSNAIAPQTTTRPRSNAIAPQPVEVALDKKERKKASDAAVKLADYRDKALEFVAYQQLDANTIDGHVATQIAKLEKEGVSVGSVDWKDVAGKLMIEESEAKKDNVTTEPNLDAVSTRFGTKGAKDLNPSLQKLIINLIYLGRARWSAMGVAHNTETPTYLTDYTEGFGTTDKQFGRIGRAQAVYEVMVNKTKEAEDRYYDRNKSLTISDLEDSVKKAKEDVNNLKTIDKEQVKTESKKVFNKLKLTRHESTLTRWGKKIGAGFANIGTGLISGGREKVVAETAVGNYQTEVKTVDKSDEIRDKVAEIGMIWNKANGQGMDAKGASGFIAIMKGARLAFDILQAIAGAVGFTATIAALITTPLAGGIVTAAIPAAFASIATISGFAALGALGVKLLIDAILAIYAGISTAAYEDPIKRRQARKYAKESGMNLAGDVIEGGLAATSMGVGSVVGGSSFGSGFNPATTSASTLATAGTQGAQFGAGLMAPAAKEIGDGGLAAIPKESQQDSKFDKIQSTAATPKEKMESIVEKANAAKNAGDDALVMKDSPRVRKGVRIATAILGPITGLPGLIWDIITGVIRGYKTYKKSQTP